MSKKVVFLLIAIVCILLAGCAIFSYDIGKIPINKTDFMIGRWKYVRQITKKDKEGYIKDAIMEIDENGNCTYYGKYTTNPDGTGTELDFNYSGKCYFNRIQTKIKMENDKAIILDWVTYQRRKNTIVIGNVEYYKEKK